MVSIQQWRASIGSFNSSKSKQTYVEAKDAFKFSKGDNSCDRKVFKLSRKFVLTSALLTLAFLSIVNCNDRMKNMNHSAVIKTLLIRSGIEQNPGPTPAEVVGSLISAAPNDTVKKTLNKFETEKDYKANFKNFQKSSITADDFKKTLVYLDDRVDD